MALLLGSCSVPSDYRDCKSVQKLRSERALRESKLRPVTVLLYASGIKRHNCQRLFDRQKNGNLGRVSEWLGTRLSLLLLFPLQQLRQVLSEQQIETIERLCVKSVIRGSTLKKGGGYFHSPRRTGANVLDCCLVVAFSIQLFLGSSRHRAIGS